MDKGVYNEVDEIHPEDIEAAADFYDKLLIEKANRDAACCSHRDGSSLSDSNVRLKQWAVMSALLR